MRINGQFVVALHRVYCDAKLHNGIKLIEGLRLIDDFNRVECLKYVEFRDAIGGMECEYLKSSRLLVVSEPRDFEVQSLTEGANVVGYMLNLVRQYLFHLWTIRDSCAYFEQGFLFNAQERTTHSNLLITSLSKADGTQVDTKFSRKELESVRMIQREVDSIAENAAAISNEHNSQPALASGRDISSFERFRRFILFARETRDLGLKIAMFCSSLEAILSSGSSSELAHRIAERVALLAGDTLTERIEIFELMKKLYAIRSAVLHGDDVSKKHSGNLANFCKIADLYVRCISIRYYTCQEFKGVVDSGGETLERYFAQKLFGPK